ncbi:MAG TPA: hypothetical protein VGW38_19830, partial [Chloroflexota bacterium]|nr:hypothetical protein [Chloroflexota bacterium]
MRLFWGKRVARAAEAHVGGVLSRMRAGRARIPDAELDHGHVPFTAWEAELSAYARMRTGMPIKVLFALSNQTLWTDVVHLARPPAGLSTADAFHASELTLEHAVMHHRHGWREAALLWHTWCFPSEEIALPWPPWDQIPLPATVIRHSLEEAVPALQIASGHVLMRDRLRHAARWIAATWADGAHRSAEIRLRPGLEERLPLPTAPQPTKPWSVVLYLLATREPATDLHACLPSSIGEALEPLLAPTDVPDYAPVAEVLALVEGLAGRQLLPPVPELRPDWLHPLWGRWHAEARLRTALDEMARSPTALASASNASRAAVRSTFRGGGGGVGAWGRVEQQRDQQSGHVATQHGVQAIDGQPQAPATDQHNGWGVQPDQSRTSLPSLAPSAQSSQVSEASAEGSGHGGDHGSGVGAGTLGELHIVTPTAEDRAAYWQLRGALAPQIEQLVERIRSA